MVYTCTNFQNQRIKLHSLKCEKFEIDKYKKFCGFIWDWITVFIFYERLRKNWKSNIIFIWTYYILYFLTNAKSFDSMNNDYWLFLNTCKRICTAFVMLRCVTWLYNEKGAKCHMIYDRYTWNKLWHSYVFRKLSWLIRIRRSHIEIHKI